MHAAPKEGLCCHQHVALELLLLLLLLGCVAACSPAVGRALASTCWLRRSSLEARLVSLVKSRRRDDAPKPPFREIGCILRLEQNQRLLSHVCARTGEGHTTHPSFQATEKHEATLARAARGKHTSSQARIASKGSHVD